jgi:hypothetical protein
VDGSLAFSSFYLAQDQASCATQKIYPLSPQAQFFGPRCSFPGKGVFGGPTWEYSGVLLGSVWGSYLGVWGSYLVRRDGSQLQYITLTGALVLWRASRIMWECNATDPIRYRSNLNYIPTSIEDGNVSKKSRSLVIQYNTNRRHNLSSIGQV